LRHGGVDPTTGVPPGACGWRGNRILYV
jgi:hypothetical protein